MRSAPLCGYATEPHTRPDCGLTPVVAFGATRLCAACAARRSTLGKGQRPRPLQAPAVDVLTWLCPPPSETCAPLATPGTRRSVGRVSADTTGRSSVTSSGSAGKPLNNASASTATKIYLTA